MNSTCPNQILDAHFVWPNGWLDWDPAYTYFLPSAILGIISYFIFIRLVFHPLAQVPGPRLAGLTKWFEFYYDVVCDGEYLKYIERMHSTYIHVNDPEVYKNTFASASPFEKSKFFYSSVGVGQAIGAIIDRKQHHIRRALLSPPLRANAVLSYSPTLYSLVMNCADIMAGQASQGKSINLLRYTRSLTVDVIGDFTFGRPMGLVNGEDTMPELIRDLQEFSSHFHMWKHFPLYRKLLKAIPDSISRKWMPGFVQLREKCTAAVNEYLADKKAGKPVSNTPNEGTFLDFLLNPPLKITSEPCSPTVLIDEGSAFITGGSDTTGLTMENATYLILRHPNCLQKLRRELDEAIPHIKDNFSIQHVIQLPFLSAVVKETLRLYTPAASPLPRTVPEKGVEIHGHFLPGGTILTHSLYLIHHNPDIFSNPKIFQPERWLGPSGKDLEQNFFPFSKGSRSCIGMTLAYHEIYTYLSVMFSRFDMELFEMRDRDMDWCDHFFVKRKGVLRIRIVRDRWNGGEFIYS